MDPKRVGLLAGLGLIISLLGFIPGAGPVISLIGDVLYLTGVYYISKHADKSVFTYILISTILSFVALIISRFSHLASVTASFVLGIGGIFGLIVTLVLGIIGAILIGKAYSLLGASLNMPIFEKAGKMHKIGGCTLIILIGLVFIVIGFVMSIVGFFQMPEKGY